MWSKVSELNLILRHHCAKLCGGAIKFLQRTLMIRELCKRFYCRFPWYLILIEFVCGIYGNWAKMGILEDPPFVTISSKEVL